MEQGKVQEYKEGNCLVEEKLDHVNLQAQNKEYNEYMELVKTLDITEFAPPEWLNHTETPFKWAQCLKPNLLFKSNLDSKLDDYSYDNSYYTLEKCSLLLTLVFEKVILKDNAKSRTYLNQFKAEILKISSDESNDMFTRIGPALKHVYSATNAYLMSLTSDLQLEETAKKIGGCLEPISQMSPQMQAGFEALKGKFYLWCCTDSEYAFKHILAASKLDPDFAPWQYWTGKILRKIRRQMKEKKEPKDEIAYLESAVEKQRDPKHLIYLAQAYREKANFLHKAKSNDFEYFKSDLSKEVDALNQKSLDLYSNTHEDKSEKWTGPTIHQVKERIFNCEINLVVCSEKMDLFLTANSRGEVSLHRSLDLQTVWTKSPPNSEVKLVQKLTWRPDSQAIAIAYSYNKAGSSNEDSVSKAIVLVVTIENEDVNSINVEGDVTCLDWSESKITSTVPACFTNYFPEPTPLSSTFCAGADLKNSKHLFKRKSDKTVNFLVIGSSIGELKVLVSGFLLCCSLSVSSLIRLENKKYWIRNAAFSSDMKFMFVFIEERVDNITFTEVDAQVLILDTSVLSLRIAEINLLQTRIGQMLTLVDHIKEVQSCLTEVWECLKVAEVASNFSKYQLHFESIESMVADICELIMFGVLSNSLEQFLLQSLNCNCVKKLIQSVKENCLNVETLISGHLKPFLEELLIILGEMKGMAELNQFRVLGLTTNFLSIASNNVRTLILKAAEFYVVVQSLEKKCTAFCQWLNLVITQLNSDEIQVLDTSEGLIDNNLFLITDYLNSICHISYSCDKPVSFFQHLGQYFDDICLLKPLEPHKWQRFLEDRIDLVTVTFFIPVSRTLSLAQVFKSCYESISNICSAPEKAISPTFSVKHVVELPEMSSDCSTVESCYFTDNLTLVTGFVNQKNTGEFSLVEVSPHKQNNIKCQKVLKLGNENDFKCLGVKWCHNEKIYALFEEMKLGSGSLFLTQIEKPVINTLKSDYIDINSIKDGVLVWEIPYLPVSCFAVSGKRKFCVAVSKNKKKITTFDIWFDEDKDIEKEIT